MLAELQREIATALTGDETRPMPTVIAGHGGIGPTSRLAIYRHHLFIWLTDVLAANFPVVRLLVDPRFFAYAAHTYIAAELPVDPHIAGYGAGFPEFLASFPPCRDLPWLADVARFEWVQAVVLAHPILPPLPATGLAGTTGPQLQPSVQLLRSHWPVDAIWQAHQGTQPDEVIVDLDDGPVALLPWRGGGHACFRRLETGEHALLAALPDGASLTAATEAALGQDALFDLLLCLRRLLGYRLIVATT